MILPPDMLLGVRSFQPIVERLEVFQYGVCFELALTGNDLHWLRPRLAAPETEQWPNKYNMGGERRIVLVWKKQLLYCLYIYKWRII